MIQLGLFLFDVIFFLVVLYFRHLEKIEFEEFREDTHRQIVALAERIDVVIETSND